MGQTTSTREVCVSLLTEAFLLSELEWRSQGPVSRALAVSWVLESRGYAADRWQD